MALGLLRLRGRLPRLRRAPRSAGLMLTTLLRRKILLPLFLVVTLPATGALRAGAGRSAGAADGRVSRPHRPLPLPRRRRQAASRQERRGLAGPTTTRARQHAARHGAAAGPT